MRGVGHLITTYCGLLFLVLLQICPTSSTCRNDRLGLTYRGSISRTITNKICQRWDVSNPRRLTWTAATWPVTGESLSASSNFCRNPTNSPIGLWCYTNDATIVWEPCFVPVCAKNNSCVNNTVLYTYSTNTSQNINGQSCSRWEDVGTSFYDFTSQSPPSTLSATILYNPATLPDQDFTEAGAKCRNPDEDTIGAWCFISNGAGGFVKSYCKPDCVGIMTCVYDRPGTYYQGDVAVTKSGVTCQRWDAQSPVIHNFHVSGSFPDGSATAAGNKCRNPDNKPFGPWCLKSSGISNPSIDYWEYCNVPICHPVFNPPTPTNPPTTPTCYNSTNGEDYVGTQAFSVNGLTCQRWDQQTPVKHPFTEGYMLNAATVADASNYCRNPDRSSEGPWCYTTNAAKPRDTCAVRKCFVARKTGPRLTCRETPEGREYNGTVNVTTTGQPCLRWGLFPYLPHLEQNFADGSSNNADNNCRNPGVVSQNYIGVFCYVLEGGSPVLRGCSVPMCSTNASTCLKAGPNYDYMGNVTITQTGKACIPWTNVSTSVLKLRLLPDESLAAAGRRCRNLDDKDSLKGPYCYTSGGTPEKCNIPSCDPEQCRNDTYGLTYTGVHSTAEGITCRRWDDVGVNVAYKDPKLFPDNTLAEASNYCRNPNNDTKGLWCYTAPNERRYCGIEVCNRTFTCEGFTTGWDYKGTHSTTIYGNPCMPWSQAVTFFPSEMDASILADGSTTAAQNYCRYASGSKRQERPWCFVSFDKYTGKNMLPWDYCPICLPTTTTEMPTTTTIETTEMPTTTEIETTEQPTTTEIETTEQPTTEMPTTEMPTTEMPTTEPPTTEMPTTDMPTTDMPTTEPPTTDMSTTEMPTTEPPTTEMPTTEPPTTEMPTTEPPTTDMSTTEMPTTEPPTTEMPTTEPPTTEMPTTEPTTTDMSTTEMPTTELPTTEMPTTEPPTTEMPTTGPLTTDMSTTEMPTTEPPTTEMSTTEMPTTEPPTTEPPTTWMSTTEMPTTELPTTVSPTTESSTMSTIEPPTPGSLTTEMPTTAAITSDSSSTTSNEMPTITTETPTAIEPTSEPAQNRSLNETANATVLGRPPLLPFSTRFIFPIFMFAGAAAGAVAAGAAVTAVGSVLSGAGGAAAGGGGGAGGGGNPASASGAGNTDAIIARTDEKRLPPPDPGIDNPAFASQTISIVDGRNLVLPPPGAPLNPHPGAGPPVPGAVSVLRTRTVTRTVAMEVPEDENPYDSISAAGSGDEVPLIRQTVTHQHRAATKTVQQRSMGMSENPTVVTMSHISSNPIGNSPPSFPSNVTAQGVEGINAALPPNVQPSENYAKFFKRIDAVPSSNVDDGFGGFVPEDVERGGGGGGDSV
nr:kringle-like protein 1 [Theama mediterranea]